MKIKYLGHSCFFLDGSKKVIIDPFMPFGDFGCASKVDITAVTHGHSDHFGDTVKIGKQTVCCHEIAQYLKRRNIPARGMNFGGTVNIDGVSFTFVPAYHSSSLECEDCGEAGIYAGTAGGFIIKIDGVTIYHAGDTSVFGDMKLIHDMYHPDIAMLPIGDTFTMGPGGAMMAAEFIGAPVVIPMHYNTFPVIEQDAGAFKSAIEKVTQMKVEIMKPGDEYTVNI